MRWHPTLRWIPISSDTAIELGLSPMKSWQALALEWGRRGIFICARSVRIRARLQA